MHHISDVSYQLTMEEVKSYFPPPIPVVTGSRRLFNNLTNDIESVWTASSPKVVILLGQFRLIYCPLLACPSLAREAKDTLANRNRFVIVDSILGLGNKQMESLVPIYEFRRVVCKQNGLG